MRRHTRYKIAQVLWLFGAFGVGMVVFTGQAEPLVGIDGPPTDPRSVALLFGGLFAAVVAGVFVISTVENRAWKATGRRLDLQPESGLLSIGKPDLVGRARGREVRVRTVSRGSGGSEGGSNRTYTIAETRLRGSPSVGLVAVRERTNVLGGTARGIGDGSVPQVTVGEFEVVGPAEGFVSLWTATPSCPAQMKFEVVGPAEGFVRAVFSPRVQQALDDAGEVDSLYVGDAAGTMTDATSLSDSSLVGGLVAKGITASIPGDASTAVAQRRGVTLDPDTLERQIDAVVEVAEAFESALAEAHG